MVIPYNNIHQNYKKKSRTKNLLGFSQQGGMNMKQFHALPELQFAYQFTLTIENISQLPLITLSLSNLSTSNSVKPNPERTDLVC